MSWSEFCTQFAENTFNKHSKFALRLIPNLDRLPLPIQRFDEPLFPFSKEIIQATNSYIGVYIFDLSAYVKTGASGIVALERSIAYANSHAITILHGPFIGRDFGSVTDVIGLNVDSFTVTNLEDALYYVSNPPYTCFLWSSNALSDSDGGCVDNENLRLYQNGEEIQELKVLNTESLLTDLTESYAENILKQIKSEI